MPDATVQLRIIELPVPMHFGTEAPAHDRTGLAGSETHSMATVIRFWHRLLGAGEDEIEKALFHGGVAAVGGPVGVGL